MNNTMDSRNKILLTASRLFQLQGYHATGINQIIKESGSPKGSLYYYFPDGKEELAVEAVKQTRDFVRQKIKMELDKIDDPLESIQSFINTVAQEINILEETIPYTVSLLTLETSLISEPLREICRGTFEAWENLYAEKLVQGGFNEETAEELGVIIQIMMEGAFISSLAKKDVTPLHYVTKQIPILLSQK